jgi:ATP-dependent Clp protease protease subunit
MIQSTVEDNKTVLYKPKESVIVNEFNDKSFIDFFSKFQECLDFNPSIIPIYIHSSGGKVNSLMAMIDVIKSSPVPVATIAIGKAFSCGAILLTSGFDGYRYATPNSSIMIHEFSHNSNGKIQDIMIDANETFRLNDSALKMMSNNCGKEDDYFKKIVREKSHLDWYLTPQECLEHNIINHIGLPKFQKKTTTVSTFL